VSFLEEYVLKCKSLQRYLPILVEPVKNPLKYIDFFYLQVSHECVGHQTVFEHPPRSMQMPGQQHGNLKSVTILGFCYAKSSVELTCYIVENTSSLESLTLNIHGTHLVSVSGIIMRPMYGGRLVEAPKTLLAIRTYIQGKIPSTVKLNVMEPCGPCNTVGGSNLS
jgi:hypothetical protein